MRRHPILLPCSRSARIRPGRNTAALGTGIGAPFVEDVRERLIEAAARQSGMSQEEVDRLWELHALAAAAEDPRAVEQRVRAAGAGAADTDRNNDPARLRDALEARLGDGDRLSFSDADLALLARAERAAAPGRGAPAAGGRHPLEGWALPG